MLLCLLLFAASPHAAQMSAPPQTFDADLSVAVFDDVWQNVFERYYAPARLDEVGWRELRRRLRPVAAKAQTPAELYRVLRRLTSALNDSHTRVSPPGEADDWRRVRFTSTGISLIELDGRLFVAGVDADSAARGAGVRRGDEVVTIDGRAWRELLRANLAQAAGASNARIGRVQAVRRLLDGAPASSVELTLANVKGRARAVRLVRAARQVRPELLITPLGKRTYRVRFNLFTADIAAEFGRALRGELSRADSLVIDLRGNGGGDAEAMIDLLGIFLPPGQPLGRFVDRAGRTASPLQTRAAMLSAAERGAGFQGSIVILTATPTASAAEIFTDALQTRRRAVVVGERTCGCVLAINRRHRLADGGTLDVSELDYRTADDRRLEGAGVLPDEQIALTRADLLANRDPALARSVQLARLSRKPPAVLTLTPAPQR